MSGWCAPTLCGRGSPRGEGGEYWALFPGKGAGTWAPVDDKESSYTCQMLWPVLKMGRGVKAVRILPSEMYIFFVFINVRKFVLFE